MSVEAAFTDQIAKIKRQVAVAAVHGILLNAGLIFLGLQLILLIVALTGLIDTKANGSLYLVSIGIALSAALLIGFGRRRNFLDILIGIDRRLGLQDRLSTAYEYLKSKKDSEFKDLLMQDAAAAMSRLNRRQLVPFGLSRRHLIFIILLLSATAIYTIDYRISGSESAHVDQKAIEHAGALLQQYTFKRFENKTLPQTGPQASFSRKLEQLGSQLDDRSLTSEQLFTALADTLEEVQAERNRLSDALAARLNAAGIQGLSLKQIPSLAKLPPDEAAKFKELLNRASNSRIPDAVNKDIESLEELGSIAEFLSRLVEDAQKDLSESAESAAPAGDESQASQVTGGTDSERNDPLGSTPEGRLTGPDRSSPDRSGAPGSHQQQENGGDLRNDEGQHEGYSTSAGRGESAGEKKSSAEIEKSRGPAMSDKMASSPVKSYLVHIRALTDSGEARLKEEDIHRTYGKAVESILQKEDIPLNYREYIKNYFMAIGLNTEENADESK